MLKEDKFDIIHVHNLMPLLVTSLIESLVDCPVVFTFYNTPNQSHRAIGYFEEPELDLVLAKSIIIAGSKFSKAIVTSKCYYDFAIRLGIPEKLITFCYLGVEQDGFSGNARKGHLSNLQRYFGAQLDDDDLTILLPGRIVERKGVIETIQALAEVNKSLPAKLILTGMTLPFNIGPNRT